MSDGDDVWLVDLSLDILSAITFLVVLIHLAFTPTFEPISNPQKNLAKARPMIDFLLVCKVQFIALVLSAMHITTGCGSYVCFPIFEYNLGGTVVDNYGRVFETIDRNECFV